MDKINWCIKQKNGIELVEPSDNLRDAYLIKAEEALDTLRTSKSRDWQLTTAYYTIYHGIYSVFMGFGIKCEIHSCTIAFTKRFLKSHFSDADFDLIDMAFSARIDSQYYVNRKVSNKKVEFIISQTPKFLVKCKNIVFDQREISEIRSVIKNLIN